jgi:anti-anti-sigma regulatory factor
LDPDITPTSDGEHSSIASDPHTGPHCLPQVLDLTAARSLRDDMTALLQSGTIVLDAGAVERLSTPCAQVLLAAGLAAEAANSRFWIVNASDCFQTAVADLGLQSQFTNWMV